MRSRLLGWVCTAVLALGCEAAGAALTQYDVELTIQTFHQGSLGCGVSPEIGVGERFGCIGVGDTFRGHFSVDSSILAVDGINTTASIFDFYMPFGDVVYSTGSDNTALSGFRNSMGFAAAPGFLIENGQVVDLLGGVFGRADVPFIDFYSPGMPGAFPRNSFSALDVVNTQASGSLRVVTPVPEPETYLMWMLGIAVVGYSLTARKRRS